MNQTLPKLRPLLSATMKEALMNCHEAALMKLEPYEAGSLKYAKGLINRGLLEPRTFISERGKRYTAVYITPLGEHFLTKM